MSRNNCFYIASIALHNTRKKCFNESTKREGGEIKEKKSSFATKKSVTNLTDKHKFEGTRFFIVGCKQTFFSLQSANKLIVFERKCSLHVIMCVNAPAF
jgi:hypothetical protein